jgi:Zn-dependent protease
MEVDRITTILMSLFALAIAIPVHEFAHAASATIAGDDTPRRQGRLTIFPWDHFDPLGALCCILSTISGFGLGWGKPVMCNPANMRSPRWSFMWVAAWGPISNLILALLFALPLRFEWVSASDPLWLLFEICLRVNLGLMLFNLIPVYPLDGSKIASALLPNPLARQYDRFMVQWGMPIMLLLVFTGSRVGIFHWLIGAPMGQLLRVLLPNWYA